MSDMRYAMAIDVRRCVGCNACVLACKAENNLPPGTFRNWITEVTQGEYPDLTMEIRSERCNHCDLAPCVSVCPTGASHIAEGGVVLVDPEKCTGCKACVASCAYDARAIHPDGHVDKCTFCLHRVQQGQRPACETVCPARAITFGDINDPHSDISKLLARRQHKTLHPELGLGANVYYLT